MKILLLICFLAVVRGDTFAIPAVCTGACMTENAHGSIGTDDNLIDHPPSIQLTKQEQERLQKVTENLERRGHLNRRLLNVCKPEGHVDCPDVVDGVKQSFIDVCIEGYPCEKKGRINAEWTNEDICEMPNVLYYNPFFRQCWDGGNCWMWEYTDRGIYPEDQNELCRKLAPLKTVADLERVCKETKGDVSHRLCCALEKPYQVCEEYCSISWQSEFLTVCRQKNCCKDCEYNDRPCVELDDAKATMQYLVDHRQYFMDMLTNFVESEKRKKRVKEEYEKRRHIISLDPVGPIRYV